MPNNSTNLSPSDYLVFKLYSHLPARSAPTSWVHNLIRNFYFSSKIQHKPVLNNVWLQDYFRLLVGFNGICQYIDENEAVSAIGFRKNLNQRVLLHTRVNDSSDLAVAKQIWELEEYAPVVDCIRQYLSDYDTVPLQIIDAGANVGYTTLYLKAAFPNAHIVSLEPEDSNFKQLSRNIAINHLTHVTPLQAGLWKREAHLQVERDFRDHREWSFHVKEADTASGLKGYSVLDVMRQQQWDHIDLLKIDIEGAERYIFENADLAAEVLKFTRFVAIEIHDEFDIRNQIYDYLKQNHFEFFEHGESTIGRNTLLT